jgi:hypothetical protein
MTNPVSFLAAVSAIFGLLMILACARRWVKEYAGLGETWSTLAVSFGIVSVYYGILVACFWQIIPFVTARD